MLQITFRLLIFLQQQLKRLVKLITVERELLSPCNEIFPEPITVTDLFSSFLNAFLRVNRNAFVESSCVGIHKRALV